MNTYKLISLFLILLVSLELSAQQTTTYEYDNLYRLVKVSSDAGTTIYSYDALGNRTEKRTSVANISTHTLTVVQPANGTIVINNRTTGSEVSSGSILPTGTALIATATPHALYELEKLFINNMEQPNGSEFVLDRDITVTALMRSTTSTDAVELEALHIYPNPSHGYITVVFPPEKTIGEPIVIKDLSGKILKEVVLVNNSQTVDISHLAAGLYFVIVGSTTHKIVLIK